MNVKKLDFSRVLLLCMEDPMSDQCKTSTNAVSGGAWGSCPWFLKVLKVTQIRNKVSIS
jgi:hypothetical protein